MKKSISLIIILIGALNAFAQCNEFYQLKEGGEWEMESYNSKGKLTGKSQQKVISFTSQSNGFNAKVHTVISNDKGKESMQGDLDFACSNGTMTIDMRNFINEDQMKAFGNYEFDVEAQNLEIPNSLSIGQSLKDGSIIITATNSPIPMTMTVTITDRKVIGKESVTTPAGTYDCYKITSNSTIKTKTVVGVTLNFSAIEWLAPKAAIVKSETYNKNGKLQGYSLLTKLK
jgi:hypothetical protein